MKLYVLSDLHLEFAPFTPPYVDCDVVVLAGDTDLKLRGIRWAMETFPGKPILYVFGNHEFYGEKWPRLIEKGRMLAAGTNVRILENDTFEIDGWRFFGATLWSDFQITGDVTESSAKAALEMTDFRYIRHWPSIKRFSPAHARQAHEMSLAAMRKFLLSGDRQRSVVITHHAPSAQSLPEAYKTDSTSGAYASNLTPLITEFGPRLWIHGHVHVPWDYHITETRVMANPRGYPGEQGFRDSLVVELLEA
jgi:predicted phosphodiesterase